MAIIRVTGENPTLAHVALAMNEALGTAYQASDVARAARARGVLVRDGRVSRDALAQIFHELRILSAAKLCNPEAEIADEPPRSPLETGFDDGCRCWNEGEWGRVHREDCPVHGA